MKNILQKYLLWLAKKILKKYHPLIIGITGSVGKTSAKEAIFSVVSQKFSVRKPEKNFNTEFGLPYAILGLKDDPGKNILSWLNLIWVGSRLVWLNSKYPKILILEMGIDHPGDMDYFMSFAKPNIGIITAIGESHLGFFESLEGIEEEKGKIAKALSNNDTLILNADNEATLRQQSKTQAAVLTYGSNNSAVIKLTILEEDLKSLTVNFKITGPHFEFNTTSKALGQPHLLALACACAVADVMKIEEDLIIKGISEYRPTPGRQNFISGIKKSIILDDSYNSSPTSTKSALLMLEKFSDKKKIVFLGDMLELGKLFEQAHTEIGQFAATLNLDKLITVGVGGKLIAEGAKQNGLIEDKILSFNNSEEALNLAAELVQPESIILVKGSQSMRMEKITKEILAEPMQAKNLLCRQYGKWLEK